MSTRVLSSPSSSSVSGSISVSVASPFVSHADAVSAPPVSKDRFFGVPRLKSSSLIFASCAASSSPPSAARRGTGRDCDACPELSFHFFVGVAGVEYERDAFSSPSATLPDTDLEFDSRRPSRPPVGDTAPLDPRRRPPLVDPPRLALFDDSACDCFSRSIASSAVSKPICCSLKSFAADLSAYADARASCARERGATVVSLELTSLKSHISRRSRRRARTVDTSAVTAVKPYRYARESSSPPIAACEARAREGWW